MSKHKTIKQKYCTFDNQFVIEFWYVTYSTIEILNSKVCTVPTKFEKFF